LFIRQEQFVLTTTYLVAFQLRQLMLSQTFMREIFKYTLVVFFR